MHIKPSIFLLEKSECPPLKKPTNGGIIFSENGKRARFYCNRGFTIKGDPIVVCKNRKWNSRPPVCVK